MTLAWPTGVTTLLQDIDDLVLSIGQALSASVLSGGTDQQFLKETLDQLQGIRGLAGGLLPGTFEINIGPGA